MSTELFDHVVEIKMNRKPKFREVILKLLHLIFNTANFTNIFSKALLLCGLKLIHFVDLNLNETFHVQIIKQL